LLVYFPTYLSTSSRIHPFCFQAGGRRKRPNLALVFFRFIFCCIVLCYGLVLRNLNPTHVCVCAWVSLYATVVHSTEQFCLFSLLTSRQLLKLKCCVLEGKGTQQAESCSAVVDVCVIAKQHCVCVIVWCCLSCTFVQHWVTLRLVLIDVLIADVLGLICCLVTAHFWILHKLSLFSEIIYLLIQSKSTIVVAKYCDEHVCLCVCLSVRIS